MKKFDKELNYDVASEEKISKTNEQLVQYMKATGEEVAAEQIQYLIDQQKSKKEQKPVKSPIDDKLLRINTDILATLKKIEENQFDEQDTSITRVSAQESRIKFPTKSDGTGTESKEEDDSKIMDLLNGMLAAMGISSLADMMGGKLLDKMRGAKGDRGKPGKDGRNAKPAKPGKDGKNGKNGKNGLKGQKGDKGTKGEKGPKGDRGPAGRPGGGPGGSGGPGSKSKFGLKGLGKGIGGGLLGLGLGAYAAYETFGDAEDYEEQQLSDAQAQLEAGEIDQDQFEEVAREAEDTTTAIKSEAVGGVVGGAAGAWAGAAAGAAIGSVVPIIGTAIGGFIGGTLGYMAGDAAGKLAGGEVGEVINADKIEERYPGIVDYDIWGDSEIQSWDKVAKLKSKQIQEIINFGDFDDEDMDRLKDIRDEVLAYEEFDKQRTQNKVAAIEAMPEGTEKTQAEVQFKADQGETLSQEEKQILTEVEIQKTKEQITVIDKTLGTLVQQLQVAQSEGNETKAQELIKTIEMVGKNRSVLAEKIEQYNTTNNTTSKIENTTEVDKTVQNNMSNSSNTTMIDSTVENKTIQAATTAVDNSMSNVSTVSNVDNSSNVSNTTDVTDVTNITEQIIQSGVAVDQFKIDAPTEVSKEEITPAEPMNTIKEVQIMQNTTQLAQSQKIYDSQQAQQMAQVIQMSTNINKNNITTEKPVEQRLLNMFSHT
jgi:hypothetical protein